MGAYLSTPVTDKEIFCGEATSLAYGGGSMQVWGSRVGHPVSRAISLFSSTTLAPCCVGQVHKVLPLLHSHKLTVLMHRQLLPTLIVPAGLATHHGGCPHSRGIDQQDHSSNCVYVASRSTCRVETGYASVGLVWYNVAGRLIITDGVELAGQPSR